MDDKIVLLIDGKSKNPELEEKLALVFQDAFEMWKEKQLKYGPNNIAQLGRSGILDRMFSDKYQRLLRFNSGEAPDEGEGEEDAWLDNVNYSAMGLMVYRGWWPGASDRMTVQQYWTVTKKFIGGLLK